MEGQQEIITRLMPTGLGKLVRELPPAQREGLEELRLRLGGPLALIRGGREEVPLSWRETKVTERDLGWVLEAAGRGSVHTVLEQFREGFLALEGGNRLGLCGNVVRREGGGIHFQSISSLSLRLCREVETIGPPLIPQLLAGGSLQSTLIFSPPGGGKTTLLRDLIRCVSDGVGLAPLRVGVADERGELCGLLRGRAQRNVGPRTDIIDGCPKAQALLMLLRGMNPQVLAADEITASEDVRAVEEAAGCGVTLLATAHGASPQEVALRPVYRALLKGGIFGRFVWISLEKGQRVYKVLEKEAMEACFKS